MFDLRLRGLQLRHLLGILLEGFTKGLSRSWHKHALDTLKFRAMRNGNTVE